MSVTATAERIRDDELPIALALTDPQPFDHSPLDDVARELIEAADLYDPVTQISRNGNITMRKTKSPGICCVYVGFVDVSSRDTVSDD